MATEVYIKAFIDGRLGYSSAVGVVMAAIMTVFGLIYLAGYRAARAQGGLLMAAIATSGSDRVGVAAPPGHSE